MGHDLTRMLRAGMPSDWTAGERVVALVLADVCSDKTHTGYVSNAQLCEETGYTPLGLRHALERLGRRGFEFRVPVGTGSDGRLVYTNRGRATDYRVPILRPREKGVPTGTPSQSERRPREDLKASSSGPKGVLTRPPLPLQPLATTNTDVPVVTPTGGKQPGELDGGAARLPIERAAWLATRGGM